MYFRKSDWGSKGHAGYLTVQNNGEDLLYDFDGAKSHILKGKADIIRSIN